MNNQFKIYGPENWRVISNSIQFGALFILLLIFFSVNAQLHGQDIQEPIWISNSVGDTLDATERDLYNLFPSVENYRYAVFILDRDSSLTARVTVVREGGEQVLIFPECERLNSFLTRIYTIENDSSRSGKDVTVLLANSILLVGELLSAGDSAIIIEPMVLSTESKYIIVYRDSIRRITIQGESKILKGALTGTLVGGALGGIIGYASGDDPTGLFSFSATAKAGILAAGLGTIGLVVGLVDGISSSTKDEVFYVRDDFCMSSLRVYSKFPLRKPGDFRINRQ